MHPSLSNYRPNQIFGGPDGPYQRIYKTKKPRQRTRRPKAGPWSEFNAAILLNITPVAIFTNSSQTKFVNCADVQ
jgi:hypothetical protein